MINMPKKKNRISGSTMRYHFWRLKNHRKKRCRGQGLPVDAHRGVSMAWEEWEFVCFLMIDDILMIVNVFI